MYKAYNLELSKGNCIESVDISQNKQQKEVTIFHKHLFDKIDNNIELTNDDGSIDVSKLKEIWFPQKSYDIFLSHSHEDKELATKLATYLKKNFNLNTFIDSNVWGYSNELLKEIDNKYCVSVENEETGHITYDYEKRNYSTSQVNLILSSALHDMINSCECIIFLNTKNSISMQETINQKTNSPWIYDELQTTRIIKPNIPNRLKNELRNLQKSNITLFESVLPKFWHDITEELNKMTKIDDSTLTEWYDNWSSTNQDQQESLDILYSITDNQ